ncbi:response regulator transcription factor [Clostridium sp. PL3]|uniref:Response regulator transcription factor n=1 Tax=Clostridium thailandense TaxID=2794346 RepID=A0A949TUB9_9CLOT|nr:response regulator transcription factor [Clostridium thailandense]MBV7271540.1 response regulator transcription factor [Clostridium thailandense]
MNSIIISNYTLIREGLCSIATRCSYMKLKLDTETIMEAVDLIREEYIDIVFFHLHKYNQDELNLIKEIKDQVMRTKFIIVDFQGDKELFVRAIKCNVDGYILGKSTEMEILYVIDQVYKGKKYYDSFFIDSMINESSTKVEDFTQLTPREREILCEIGKGMSNREISHKFYISENTVKKHVNHIFEKLNLSDRTQVALYANKCGVIRENAS